MSFLPMALDGLMAVLLAITIAYAAMLNRRLATWRNDKAELEKLIERFNRAAQHADIGISNLKEASEATGRALSQATAKGQALRDDLAFLIERAEPVADRLAEQTRRVERPRRPVEPAAEPRLIIAEENVAPPPAPVPPVAVKQKAAAPAVVAPPAPQAAELPHRPVVRPYRPGETASARGSAERNLLKALSSLRKG